MVTVKVAGDAVAGYAELLRETHALMTARASIARKILLRVWRVGVSVRLDGVDAVAISADRRLSVAVRDGLSVNAGIEGICDFRVALAACGRHIELVNGRRGLVGGENLVIAVAIGTDGGLLRSVGDGASVHARLIRDERLSADAVLFHEEFLPVAPAAGGGNVGVVDRRIRMAGRENAVLRSVAVNTCGRGGRSACGLCMHAVRERILRGGVAIAAGNLGRRIVVHQALYIFVAIDAAQHLSVNGVLELILVYEKTYRLAVFVVCERAVAVAGETVGVLQLLGCARMGCRGNKRNAKRTEQQKSNSSHVFEETLMGEKVP